MVKDNETFFTSGSHKVTRLKKVKCGSTVEVKPKPHCPIILRHRNSRRALLCKPTSKQLNIPHDTSCEGLEEAEATEVQETCDYRNIKTEPTSDKTYAFLNENSSEEIINKPPVKTEILENCEPFPWNNLSSSDEQDSEDTKASHTEMESTISSVYGAIRNGQQFELSSNNNSSNTLFRDYASQNSMLFSYTDQVESVSACHFPTSNPPCRASCSNFFPYPQRGDSSPDYFQFPSLENSLDMPVHSRETQAIFHHPFPAILPKDAIFRQFSCSAPSLAVPAPPNLYFNGMQSYFVDTRPDDSLTNIAWLGKFEIENCMPVPLKRQEMLCEVASNIRMPFEEQHESDQLPSQKRPPYSYSALIQFAINSSPNQQMTLRRIYKWIEQNFPYYKTAKAGWKNSIRHNLSLRDMFVRIPLLDKSFAWTIRPECNNVRMIFHGKSRNQQPFPLKSPSTPLPYYSPHYYPECLLQEPSKEMPYTCSSAKSGVINSCPRFSDFYFNRDTSIPALDQPSRCIPVCVPGLRRYATHFFSESKTQSPTEPTSRKLRDSTGLRNKECYKNHLSVSENVNDVRRSTKRLRKERLTALNDSLNSYPHFLEA